MAAKAATLTTTRARKTRPRWVRLTKRIFWGLVLLGLVGASVFGVVFVREMRHASELMTTLPEKLRQYSTQPTKIISADGQVLYTVQSEFREPVKTSDIPKPVLDAMVAAEDKRFMEHSGVDYWAMGRILMVGAKEGRLSQGGSTLTMQLAKRFYSGGERTFNRKLQDIALAITMERDMTKEQILTLYLNTMYFGEKAYGIQAASEVYFGKPISKLTIAEAAMLARCVRRPSDENPVKNLEKATENRNVVLRIMRDENKITQEEYEQAVAEKVKLSKPKDRITSHMNKAPYFVDHVLMYLEDELQDVDLKAGGYTIYTTLDTKMQAFAEKEVIEYVKARRRSKVNSAAFVLMDKDGKILAEVGGVDYKKSQFNIVTQGLLQPGSSFKPILYATALTDGALSMNDRLENREFTYAGTEDWAKPWVVHNASSREDSGPVSVDKAMALSLNVPAAHVMERVGPQAVQTMANSAFGILSINRQAPVPSMALGSIEVHPLEMAQAYSVFMLHGDRATPYCVTKVVGPDGNVVRTYEPKIVRNVLDMRVAAQIDELLRSVIDHGTASGTGADGIPNSRGKTGTTTAHKDAWFCGYADGLVGIGWMGNMVVRKGRVYQEPMGSNMWGATAASGFWVDIMAKAHSRFASKIPEPEIPKEEDVFRDSQPEVPEDRVRVIPPDEVTIPPDGTTGGDGKPVTIPDQPPTTTGTTTGGTAGDPPVTDPGRKPPDDPPTRRDPPRRRDDEETNSVQVDVCAESGMKATIYCPETVSRTFRKGRAPRGRCPIHGG